MAHVAKSDDNVEVDLDTLTSALQSPGRGAGHWAGLVTCPTLCYGMRVIRETRAGMTGNWSHSAAEERSHLQPSQSDSGVILLKVYKHFQKKDQNQTTF